MMGLLMTNCSGVITKSPHLSSKLDNPSVSRGGASPPIQNQQVEGTTLDYDKTRTLVVAKDTKTCADYELPIKQAVQAFDLDQLDDLLFALNRQADCPVSYLEAVKLRQAQIAAARADDLTQQGQLTNAQSWLRRAPTFVWGTQVVHGDIAANQNQWQTHYFIIKPLI